MTKIFNLFNKKFKLALTISLFLIIFSGCNKNSEVKTKNVEEVDKVDLTKYHEVNAVVEDHMIEDSIKKDLITHEKVLKILSDKLSLDDIFKEYSKNEYYIPLDKTDYMVSFLNKVTNNTIIYNTIDVDAGTIGYLEIHRISTNVPDGYTYWENMEKYYDTLYDNKEAAENGSEGLTTWMSKEGHVIGLGTIIDEGSTTFQTTTLITYNN